MHFTKAQGAPVKYTDDPNAAAYREIDMQKRFHLSATQLAQKTGVTVPMASAMKKAMKLDEDKECMHLFTFGKAKHRGYSDKALVRMREFKERADLKEIWKANRSPA